jgi:hypothetical protein
MNPFCAKTLKLTVLWCHMVTMTHERVKNNGNKVGTLLLMAAPHLMFRATLFDQSETHIPGQ